MSKADELTKKVGQLMRGSVGIGFLGLLALLFIGLKLTDHIGWLWWWVLAPLWVAPALILVIFSLVAVMVVLAVFIDGRKAKKI